MITAGLLLALCVTCVFLGYFVGAPGPKDGVEDSVNEAVATNVAPLIAGVGIVPEAGTYTLTEDQVNQQIQTGDVNLQDLTFDITPSGLDLHFGDQGRDFSYTAQVTAVDGKIQIEGADLSGVPTWLIPADAISNGVEQGINSYLEEHNLTVSSVTLQDGSMTLMLEDAAPAS